MREILFRGKRVDNGEWVYGYLRKIPCAIQVGSLIKPWYIEVPPKDPDDNGGLFNVFEDSIGQYTGLTDMNGTRIFEGDIVLRHHNLNFLKDIGRVFWYNQTQRFLRTSSLFNNDCPDMKESCEYEVIGNIHDNPELLESEEK